MKNKTNTIITCISTVAIIGGFVAFVFIVKLFTNPSVTIGELNPLSGENIKETAITFAVITALVLVIKYVFVNNSSNNNGNG